MDQSLYRTGRKIKGVILRPIIYIIDRPVRVYVDDINDSISNSKHKKRTLRDMNCAQNCADSS